MRRLRQSNVCVEPKVNSSGEGCALLCWLPHWHIGMGAAHMAHDVTGAESGGLEVRKSSLRGWPWLSTGD